MDNKTCMSCLAMHGTEHPLTEPLNDHHCGRCIAFPLLFGQENPFTQSGQEWFDLQNEMAQMKQMGKSKYEAYKAGLFNFNQLSRELENDVFGLRRSETPLKDLINE